ncbi:MAG: tetratricopeptide repeat protein [Candidatus Omnitrophota bacterium]
MRRLITKLNNFLPSLLTVILVFFVIVLATNGIFDSDIWLHLKTGKLIVKNFQVPHVDPYSFTTSGIRWINHSWLFQVIVYLTYRFFDLDGLIMLQTLLVALSFLVLFFIGFRDTRFVISTSLVAILAIFATRSRFNLRPDILSLFFFCIFLHQLKFAKESKRIYFLVILQFIWANCHGYFFLGPFLILIFIIAELLRRNIANLPGRWSVAGKLDDQVFRRLLLLLLLSLLVSFLNPQGFRGAMYPLQILRDIISGKANYAFKHIEELRSAISFKRNTFAGDIQLNILILLAACSLVFNWQSLELGYILLFIVFLPFGLSALRNIGFLNFVTFTIIISRLEAIEEKLNKKINLPFSWSKNLAAKYIIVFALIFFLVNFASSYLFRRYYDFDIYEMKSMLSDTIGFRYPKKCVDFLIKNKLPKNMFNDFNSGAYLIFNAYPQYKVFIDGRTELYSKDFFDAYFKIMKGDRKVFDAQVEKFNIKTVFLNNATAAIPKEIFKMLYEHPSWQLVFFDESGVIFLKDIQENLSLIESLAIDLKTWSAPSFDLLKISLGQIVPEPNLSRARLLDSVGLDTPLASEAREVLRICPSSGLANFYLAKTFYKQSKYKDALQYLRLAYAYGLRNTEVNLFLAKTYFKLGNKEKALKFLKTALKENPDIDVSKDFGSIR